jgi:large subunit ribosomal protein L18e
MVRTIEYRDPGRLDLIKELEEASKKNESRIWSVIAEELGRVRRNRREVNVYKLGKFSAEGDYVVVPGKVLGDGQIAHKVNVAAYRFTAGAQKKITAAGGKTMGILELVKANPKGAKVKIMG